MGGLLNLSVGHRLGARVPWDQRGPCSARHPPVNHRRPDSPLSAAAPQHEVHVLLYRVETALSLLPTHTAVGVGVDASE